MEIRENLHVYPAPIVRASRIFKETSAIARAGIADHVTICGTATEDLPRTEDLGPERRIERIGRARDKRPPSVLGRIIDQLSWTFSVYSRFAKRDIGMVNAHSVAVLPLCYALSKRTRAKLIYDTHELETETIASRGFQGRIFRFIERTLIRKCDAVFVVNRSIADWYQKEYPGLRVVSVQNVPEVSLGVDRVDIRKLLGIPDDALLFTHTGNIVAGRNVEVILDAFGRSSSGVHVVFIGDGSLRSLVEARAADSMNIHWIPTVPHDQVVSYVRGSDAALCLIEPVCLSYRLSLPNKALEYGLAGVPFVYTRLPEITRLVGAQLPDWGLDDPSKDLLPFLDRISAVEANRGADALASVRFPTWDDEAAIMIDAYHRVLAKAQIGSDEA